MKTIFRISIYILLGALSWLVIFVRLNDVKNAQDFNYKLKARILGPCSVPLYYSLGSVDSRFGISEEDFKETIKRAEKDWEEASGKNLFQYKEDADFRINLIFDERQLATLERKKLEETLIKVENIKSSIEVEYNKLIADYDKKSQNYQKNLKEYENDLDDYEDRVKYWNEKGGAPKDEYEKLQEEADKLKKMAKELTKEREIINSLVKKINSLVGESEKIAGSYNQETETYKERFGEARDFDQGVYTGEEIDVYQFSQMTDLELVLAHELGHYLGINHLENPTSIMHYLMGEQDLENIQPTQEDLEAVGAVCK